MVGEEQQRVVGVGNLKEPGNIVGTRQTLAADALPSPMLFAVRVEFYAFDVSAVSESDDHVFVRFDVLAFEFTEFFLVNNGTPLAAVLAL